MATSAEEAGGVVVNLTGYSAETREDEIRSALTRLADGWPEGPVHGLVLDPPQLALKWEEADTAALESAIRRVGPELRVLDLCPRACNSALPESVGKTIIASCEALRTLRLEEVPLDSDTLGALGGLTELRELALGGIALSIHQPLAASALEALRSCSLLELLHLPHIDVSDGAISAIAGGCPNLTDVDLAANEMLTESGVEALARHCHGLRRLSLLNCQQVGPTGIRALGALPALADVDLQRVRGSATGVAALAMGCRQLQRLSLCVCFLLDEDVQAIRNLPVLTDLDMNATKGYGAAVLADVLPKLAALRTLSLNGIGLSTDQMDAAVRALADGDAAELTDLDLNNTQVTAAAVEYLTAALPACKVSTIHCHNVHPPVDYGWAAQDLALYGGDALPPHEDDEDPAQPAPGA